MQAIDTPESTLGRVHDVLAAGYHGVVRYLSSNTGAFPGKQLTAAEIAAIRSLPGMRIGLVWEAGFPTSAGYFSAVKGLCDSVGALRMMTHLGVPKSVPAFFTVDYDAPSHDLEGPIAAYFESVHAAFSRAGRLVGAYGSGLTGSFLKDRGLVHYRWRAQSKGFAGYAAAGDFEILQGPSARIAGLDVDTNVVQDLVVLW